MTFARQVLVIMAKDLRAELRTKEAINASLSFALVVLLLFSFAFDPSEETTREISGGLLWIVRHFELTPLFPIYCRAISVSQFGSTTYGC